MKIAYIGATFDLPHYGHAMIIEAAGLMADRVVVALNRDEFVERFKRKPILNLKERMLMVSKIKGVDHVLVNESDEDSKPTILKMKPDYIIFGDDYTFQRYKKQIGVTDEWLEEHKIKLIQVPYTKEISTSEIINRIKNL